MKFKKIYTCSCPLSWKCACETDWSTKAPVSSQRPHCFIAKQQHRNGFENKLVLSTLSSFWHFCFPLFFLSLYLFAPPRGPTRLCGHCKSTLTRRWLRFGRVGVKRCSAVASFASRCRDIPGYRLVCSSLSRAQTRLVPLRYGFPIITMHPGDPCHCVAGFHTVSKLSRNRHGGEACNACGASGWSPKPCGLLVASWRQNISVSAVFAFDPSEADLENK